jgi:hypothetical protein
VSAQPAAITALPEEPARKKSRAPLVVAILGAAGLAAGAAVFVLGQGDDSRERAQPAAPVAPPQPPPPEPPTLAPPPEVKPEVKEVTPEPPRNVIVTIDGVPEGTEVLIAGTVIGPAPGPVQVPRGQGAIVLTFRAAGYLSMSKSIVPQADQALTVTLKKKSRGGGKPTKDDIIDVFGGKK